MMQCFVCNKELNHGLYNEEQSEFCNTVCATWFARAVAHVVYLDGDQYTKMDNWLKQFQMVQNKRAKVGAHGR